MAVYIIVNVQQDIQTNAKLQTQLVNVCITSDLVYFFIDCVILLIYFPTILCASQTRSRGANAPEDTPIDVMLQLYEFNHWSFKGTCHYTLLLNPNSLSASLFNHTVHCCGGVARISGNWQTVAWIRNYQWLLILKTTFQPAFKMNSSLLPQMPYTSARNRSSGSQWPLYHQYPCQPRLNNMVQEIMQ